MKKYLLILVVLFGAQVVLFAQGLTKTRLVEQHYTVGWNIGVPLFDFSDYISAVSLSGAAVQTHFFLTNNIAAGASLGWSTFYQELGRATYNPTSSSVIMAKQYRSMTFISLKASANYFFFERIKSQPLKMVEPYVGLGIGGVYMDAQAKIYDSDFRKEQFGLQASPELGAFIYLNKLFAIHVAATYNISTNAFTFGKDEINNVQYAVFNVGLTYKIRK